MPSPPDIFNLISPLLKPAQELPIVSGCIEIGAQLLLTGSSGTVIDPPDGFSGTVPEPALITSIWVGVSTKLMVVLAPS